MNWLKATRLESTPQDQKLQALLEAATQVVLGKTEQIKLVLAALLAEGHILIEDVPGVGKTTLVKTLATLFNFKSSRIQFTNDLLPADILGTSIFDSSTQRFIFHPGPIFGQMILADELNRATAKTQSALLQAMEEHQVTVDGQTHDLPSPFFVVATQNPHEQMGTFALPESQLDRFMMRLDLGFPDREAEFQLLKGEKRERILDQLKSVAQAEDLMRWQHEVQQVKVSDHLVRYLQNLLDASRRAPEEMQGLSPRAGLSWLSAARAWAFLNGRHLVLPEDVQAVGVAIMSHRLAWGSRSRSLNGEQLARKLLSSVAVE